MCQYMENIYGMMFKFYFLTLPRRKAHTYFFPNIFYNCRMDIH